MLRDDERFLPSSCLNRARPDERVFTLRGWDEATPFTIRAWVKKRIELGKNTPDDPQIINALADADAMEKWRIEKRGA